MIVASTIDGKCITEVADWMRLDPEPVVSVVMITYNHEQFLSQAIDCVLAQVTDFPIELIIGEDCSTDKTRLVALEYQSRHPERIRVRFPQRNQGVMPNFIANLEAARGRYIALCEGDDYWCDSSKLQHQVDLLLNNPEVFGVFHDSYRLNNNTGEFRIRIGAMKIDNLPEVESLIRRKHISTASMLFKKIIFTDRHLNLLCSVRNGDYMLSLIVAEYGRWKYIPEPMSVYRIHDGGVWSGDQAVNIAKADIKFYELLQKDALFSRYGGLICQKKLNAIRQLACDYAISKNFHKSLFHFMRSIGSKDALVGADITAKKYWRVFVRELATNFGCADWFRSFVRKYLV